MTKRKSTNQDRINQSQDRINQSQDGINYDGSSLGRHSAGSSAASSAFQFGQSRSNPDPNTQDPNSSPGKSKLLTSERFWHF